jgi:glycosyltransferase involved in cell wall biosynthesis
VINALWLLPTPLSLDGTRRMTGGWLDTLSVSLVATGRVKVTAMCPAGTTTLLRCEQGVVSIENGSHFARRKGLHGYAHLMDQLLMRGAVSRGLCQSALEHLLKQEQFDIVHVHGTESVWVQLAANLRLPKVLSIQGILTDCANGFWSGLARSDVGWSPRLWIRRHEMQQRARRERQFLPEYPHVFCRGEYAQRFVSNVAPRSKLVEDGRILRPPFYSRAAWVPTRRQHPIIFSTLSAQPYKGVHHVLRSLSRPELRDVTLRVAGIGERSEYGRILARIARRLGVTEQVRLMGNLNANQVCEELLSADLYLHPSTQENTPNGLAEAMALGLPCLVSCSGGSAGYIRDGISGVTFNPFNSADVADALTRVLTDPSLAYRLGSAARVEALARHDPARVTQLVLGGYDSALNDDSQSFARS